VQTLLDQGWAVRALVYEPTAWLNVEQTPCDLADAAPDVLARAFESARTVIHLAGPNEIVAARDPAAVLAATAVATERVGEACAASGVERLIYLSTVHVYGDRMAPGATLTEDMRTEPRSAYAISRLASEHVAASLARRGYELVIFRLTNSVGAPAHPSVDRWSLVANDLCRQGALTGGLELHSSGTQWRDFVPLSAVCNTIAAAGAADTALPPGTYNLCSGRPTTVRDLALMIQDQFEHQTGVRPELRAPEPEPDPPGPYYVSVDRMARHALQLAAPIEPAVAETVRFCLDHREEL
jgi:UDP-glucose 4-epimerase